MKKTLFATLILATAISAYGYYAFRSTEFVPEVSTVTVTRGDVVDTVGATGALEAVTTVQVGSQVSGTIQALYVDFNSIVRKGDVLMRLDPSLFETQIAQAQANLVRAEADVERLRVAVDDAKTQLARAQDLSERRLISEIELETAQVALRSAEAQLKSAEAQVIQASASLNQNEVNLQHTVIRAPIDGIVISRLVDMGQTVAASLQAPELFVIAADLTKMRVIANIDESDVGRIRPNQRVTFTVDAYPAEEFEGAVSQIRLEPVVLQNVVTYATVVDAPNPELKLKPGMTATITLEIARREDVLRIPNAALRFRPTPEMFALLNQPVPSFMQRGAGNTAAGEGDTSSTEGTRGPGRGFGGGTPDPERMRQVQERLAQMSPAEREQLLERRRAGGRTGPGLQSAPGAPRRRPNVSPATPVPTIERRATTIDALFGPLPPTESTGRVWIVEDGQLRAVNVRLDVTNGTATELIGSIERDANTRVSERLPMLRQRLESLEDKAERASLERRIEDIEAAPDRPTGIPLQAGAVLVTGVSTPDNGPAPPSASSGSPLVPQFGRGRR